MTACGLADKELLEDGQSTINKMSEFRAVRSRVADEFSVHPDIRHVPNRYN